MLVVRQYGFAFVGGLIAMSAHIYLSYGRGAWFLPQRLSLTLGNALIFAHLFAFMLLAVRHIPIQSDIIRLTTGIIIGTIIGSIVWWSHLFFYLYQAPPDWFVLLLSGFALALAFVITDLIPLNNHWLKTSLSIVIGSVIIYIPIYLTHQTYISDASAQALLYFQADNPNDIFIIGLPFALTLSFFSNLPLLFNSLPHVET